MNQCALRHEVPSFELKADYLARRCPGWASLLTQPLLLQRFDLECRLAAGGITGITTLCRAICGCDVHSCRQWTEFSAYAARVYRHGSPSSRDIGNRVPPCSYPEARNDRAGIHQGTKLRYAPSSQNGKLSRSISGVLHLTWSDPFASRSFFASSTGTFPYYENRPSDN